MRLFTAIEISVVWRRAARSRLLNWLIVRSWAYVWVRVVGRTSPFDFSAERIDDDVSALFAALVQFRVTPCE
jgi:hypothetical protein